MPRLDSPPRSSEPLWIANPFTYALSEMVDLDTMQLEILSGVRKEFAVHTRRRRVPFLKRRASRIQCNDGLVLECWIWILKRWKLEAPYEIERICMLVPLDSRSRLEILPSSDDCIDGLLLSLDANWAMYF
jgi:hypothetical protein